MKPRNSPDTKVRPIGNIPGCRGRAIEIRTSAWCVEVEKHKWEVRRVNRFDSRVVGDWRERDSGGAAAGGKRGEWSGDCGGPALPTVLGLLVGRLVG